ncbi:MAG: hypothetical protein A3F92_14455 [Candidatus Rokubacteria bacterium RIFCSPLOWO2_12_FULL_71_22]|nr:MAG: hypothetical protein A3F92_14455 [Candidatus Rokubacteria bacterium RIFCSPLOWO2_12_FULL_71_22]
MKKVKKAMPKRGKRRRGAEPTVSTTMRLRSSVREDLEAWAARARRSVSDLAQELIEEGIRMRECPGIYFATEPSGRTAKVAGTGLGVWEILRDFVTNQDVARVREAFPRLSQSQVTAALLYYNRFSEEIRREIDANAALTPEALERRYPGLVQTVRAG